MDYKRYRKIEFKDFTVFGLKATCRYRVDGSPREEVYLLPDSWVDQRINDRFLPILFAVIAQGMRLLSEEVVFRIPISVQDHSFLRKIEHGFWSGMYEEGSGQFFYGGSIGSIHYPNITKTPEQNRFEVAPYQANRFALGFSGGKDSLLSLKILQESSPEHDVRLIHIEETKATLPLSDFLPVHPDLFLLASHGWEEIWRTIGYGKPWYPSISMFRFLIATIHGLHNQCSWVCNGNEYNRTELYFARPENKWEFSFGVNYGQSNIFLKTVQSYFADLGINLRCFSPIQNLTEILETKILVDRYRDHIPYILSCFAPKIEDSGEFCSCGSCLKCHRWENLLSTFKGEKPRFPISFGASSTDKEQKTLEELSEGQPISHPEILGMRVDMWHREEWLPDKVRQYLSTDLNLTSYLPAWTKR